MTESMEATEATESSKQEFDFLFALLPDPQHPEHGKPRKPKSYKWLSKSSKRRIRKGMQKARAETPFELRQLAEEGAEKEDLKTPRIKGKRSETVRFTSSALVYPTTWSTLKRDPGSVAPEITETRKRTLEFSDPFKTCYKPRHHFVCGCQLRVLCDSCAKMWDIGKWESCASGATGATPNRHFEALCPVHVGMPTIPASEQNPGRDLGYAEECAFKAPVYIVKTGVRGFTQGEYYCDRWDSIHRTWQE